MMGQDLELQLVSGVTSRLWEKMSASGYLAVNTEQTEFSPHTYCSHFSERADMGGCPVVNSSLVFFPGGSRSLWKGVKTLSCEARVFCRSISVSGPPFSQCRNRSK